MSDNAARYAIYFAPPASEGLGRFGSRWLGRNAETGERLPQFDVPGLPPGRLSKLTLEPRRYGFHATLKAPFHLANGCSRSSLEAAVSLFAATRRPVLTPSLRAVVMSSFLALCPAAAVPEIEELAAACVRTFDRFRAPPDEAETARRHTARLSERQRELLSVWGYPYVMEEFRFHMTLTGPLDESERRTVLKAASQLAGSVANQPLVVDSIALFEQRERLAAFRLIGRYPLTGGTIKS